MFSAASAAWQAAAAIIAISSSSSSSSNKKQDHADIGFVAFATMHAADASAKPSISPLLPSPPHLAAGALGGPFVIASLTPLRNAMSNAAQDQRSTFSGLYHRALGGAAVLAPLRRLRIGFTGAAVSAPAACPQWCIIGPAFHVLHQHLMTPLAIIGAAALETAITYGSQTRNAQMA